LPNSRLDKNRATIDEALVELLNTANPVLAKITRNMYRRTTDPQAMLKYCTNNWEYIGPKLKPFGITYREIASAKVSRNKGAHRNAKLGQSSNAHSRAAIIYELQEKFQRAHNRINQNHNRKTNSNQQQQNNPRQNQRSGNYPRQRQNRQKQYKYKCNSCGHSFDNPKRGRSTSIVGMMAHAEGGRSLFCPNCGRERTYDRNGNSTIFQAARDLIGL